MAKCPSSDKTKIARRGKVPAPLADRQPRLKPMTSYMVEQGLLAGSLLATQLLLAPMAQAGPEGGVVVSGKGTVMRESSLHTQINQESQNLLMDFKRFDVAADESVNISQPNVSSWFVGNIVGGEATSIFGSITANGKIALVNPRGIVFGETASVNAAGIFASALGINTDELFAGGDVDFRALEGEGGFVINQGVIEASVGGSVSLLGETVSNEGIIVATLGQVNLASGSRAVVSFGEEQIIGVEVTEEVLENNEGLRAAVSNKGTIDAAGGRVMLTGEVSKSLFDHAVNNEGIIKAKSADYKDGVIRLSGSGGSVVNTGTLDASSDGEGVKGGRVEMVSDDETVVAGDGLISATSESDQGGAIKLSGEQVRVSDNALADASGAKGGGSVTLEAESRTAVDQGARLRTDATGEGDGGTISITADETRFSGQASARGGPDGGDGGTVDITGRETLQFDGTVDTGAPDGDQGTLILNSPQVAIDDEENDTPSVAVDALENSLANIEVNASEQVIVNDLEGDLLDLGQNSLSVNVNGDASSALEADSIGFIMAGADDLVRTDGLVTVEITDGSINANALIDIAGTIESSPDVPAPLPNDPLNPANDIALVANNGRVRVRSTGSLNASARDADAEGGSILISANGFDGDNEAGTVWFGGEANVTSDEGVGGAVRLLGDRVGLIDDASIDASGALGGGEVLVGGNFQGKGSEPNALRTYVGESVSIAADAVDNGEGGTVIVWADEIARYYGDISARGGAESGDGGFVETSGKEMLVTRGSVNASAPNGNAGTWLLDPRNVEVVSTISGDQVNGDGGTTTETFDPTGLATAEVLASDIVDALVTNNTNVLVHTGTDGTDTGDITINADIIANVTTTQTLTFDAAGSIIVNNTIDASGGSAALGVSLITNSSNFDTASGSGGVDINAAINTNGGNFSSSGVAFDNTGGTITTGAGAATINHTGAVTVSASVTSTDALIDIDGSSATFTGTGAADAGTNTIDVLASSVAIDLQGGSSLTADTVVLNAQTDVTVAGTLAETSGSGGTFDIDFGQDGTGATADLSGATLTYGGTGFGAIDGGAGTADTLIGRNSGEIFATTGIDQGTIAAGEVTYGTTTGIENITGGSGTDTFNVGHDVTGSIVGGGGTDTINITTHNAGASFDAEVEIIDDTGTQTVTATTIDLTGVTAVGQSGDRIDVNADDLTMTAGDGDIYLAEADSIIVNASDSGSGVFDLSAESGITVDGALVATGISLDADRSGDGGIVTVTGTGSVDSTAAALTLDASDIDLQNTAATTLDAGTGSVTITDSANGGIGLGAGTATGALNLSDAELDAITAANLTIDAGTGAMDVEGVTSGAANVSGTTTLSGDTISFTGAASAFSGDLSVGAVSGITLDQNLSTGGFLTLDGDADSDNFGNITVNGTRVVSAQGGTLTLQGRQLHLSGAESFTGRASDSVSLESDLFAADGDTVTLNADYDFINADTIGDGVGDLLISASNLALANGTTAASAFNVTGQNITVTGTTNFQVSDTGIVAPVSLTAQSDVDLGNLTNTGGSIADFSIAFGQDGTGATLNMNSFSVGSATTGTRNFTGGAGTDEIIAPDTNTSFTVTGADSGQVIGSIFDFASVENLTGGIGNDTFDIQDGGSLSGGVDGSAGTNTLSFSGTTAPTAVTVAGASTGATGVQGTNSALASGFDNIDTIKASSTQGGTLTGSAGADTIAVTSTNVGSITLGGQSANWEGFTNLDAGDGDDTLDLSADVAGTIDGGLGTDTTNILAGFTASGDFDLTTEILDDTGTNTITVTGGARAFNLTGVTDVGATDGIDIDATSLTITGGNGAVNMIETDAVTADGLSLAGIDTGVGALTLDATGLVTIDGTFSAGSADITASGNIEDDGTNTITTTNNLTLNSTGGGIGTTGDGLDVSVGGSLAGTSGSTIDLNAADALDISGNVSATTTVDIGATGAISDANGTGSISGTTVSLTGAGIGDGTNAIQTAADTLNVAGGTGSVFVDEADGVTLDTVTADGNVTIQTLAAGTLSLDNGGAGNVVTTPGNLALTVAGDIVMNDSVSVTGTTRMDANDGIALNVDLTSGTLDLDGDANNAADSQDKIAIAGGVTLTANDMAGGSITLDATNGGIEGAGITTLNATDGIVLNDLLTSVGDLTLNANTDSNDDVGLLHAANGGIDTSANNSVISMTAEDLEVAAAINAGSADINIVENESDQIGLGAATTTSGMDVSNAELNLISTTGTLFFDENGTISVDGVTNTSATTVRLRTNQGHINFDNTASSFNSLLAQSGFSVNVNTDVSTIVGDLSLIADRNNDGAAHADHVNLAGGVTVGATNDLNLDVDPGQEGSDIHAAGDLTLSAGNDINLLQDMEWTGTATTAVTMTAAGAFNVEATQTLDSSGAGQELVISADDANLAGAIDAGASLVTIQPNTDAQGIQLGVGALADGSVLGLDDTELSNITTTGGLTLGNATNDGGITVVGAANPTNVTGGLLTLQQDTGAIDFDAAFSSGVDVSGTTASGNIIFDGSADGSGSVSSVSGNVTLDAAAGAILGAAGAFTNVAGSNLTLTAQDGIGSGDVLETNVDAITATNTATGGVDISETDAVTVVEINQDAGAVARVVAGGTITIDDSTAATPDGTAIEAVNGAVILEANGLDSSIVLNDGISTAGGGISLTADDSITANVDGDLSAGATGIISLAADADVAASGDGIDEIFMADGAIFDAGSGAVTLSADDDITLGSLITTNTSTTAVSVESTSGAIVDGGDTDSDIVAASGEVTLTAVTGIGSTDHLETQMSAVDATNTTSGSVRFINTGALKVVEIDQGGAFTSVDATDTITVDDTDGDNDGTAIHNTGSGGVTLAVSGTHSDIVLNDGISAASGHVQLMARDSITAGADGDITALGAGIISVTADWGNTLGGDSGDVLTMADGTIFDAGSGTISLSGGGDVSLGQLITTNTTTTSVSVTSTAGAIVDGGDTGGEDISSGGQLALSADTGIGSGGAIETAVASVDAGNTTSGDILLNETDAIDLVSVVNSGGAVGVNAGNAITATNVSTTGGTDTDDITLSSTTIEVDTISAGGPGDVDLTATGAIDDADADSNIAADDFSFSAGGSVGGTNPIGTSVAEITSGITTAPGNINLGETDGIILTSVVTNDGAITISAGDTITATSLDTSANDADANDITLETTGGTGDITLGALTTGGVAGDVTLVASGAVTDADGATDITAHELDITASDGISADTAVTNVAASAGGTVDLMNTGGLTVADVAGTQGTVSGVSGLGGITIAAASSLTIDSAVSDTGGGDIVLAAEGNTATDDLTINANVTASGGTGSISLYAGDSISQAGGTTVDAAGTGSIQYLAGTDYNGGSPLNGTVGGGITMAGTALASTDAGNIILRAPGGIALGTVDADDDGDSTEGNVEVSADFDGVETGQSDASGAISDVSADGVTDITGGTVTLNAATGIGATGANDSIDVTADNVIAQNTTSGGAFVNLIGNAGAGNVTLTDIDASTAGDAELLSDGDILVGEVTAADNIVVNTSAGSIQDLTAGDDGVVDLTAGTSLTLTATTGIGDVNPLEVNAPSLSIDAGTGGTGINDLSGVTVTLTLSSDGDISYAAASDILIDSVTSTGGSVTLESSGGSINDADANPDMTMDISGNVVTLSADGEIGGSAHLEIVSNSLLADVITSGNIELNDRGGTTLTDITTGAGNITVTSDNSLELGIVNATGTVDVSAMAGTLTDTGDNSSLSGTTLTLTADTGIGSTTNAINTTATALNLATNSNEVVINETDGVDLAAVSAPTFTLTADGAITDSGTLAVPGTTTLAAGSNDITLDTASNDFGSVAITSGNNVTLVDTNDITLEASTLNGLLDVSANSILANGALSAGSLDFSTTSTGTMTVDSTITTSAGGMSFDTAALLDINADLTSAGNILATMDITSVELAPVVLTAQSGDIDFGAGVGSMTVGGSGTVTLDANGDGSILLADISDAGDGPTTDLLIDAEGGVTLASVNLDDAANDGSLTIDVDSDGDESRFMDVSGTLTNLAALTVTGIGGNDSATFNGDISSAGSVTFNGLDSVELVADVDISASDIDMTSVTTLDLSGSTSNVLTSTAGNIALGDISSAASELELNAAGQIGTGAYSGGGDILIVDSTGATFSGVVDAGRVQISDTTGLVAFEDTTTIGQLVTATRGYGISFTGSSTEIQSNVGFNNSGSLILGDGSTDEILFDGGATATAGPVEVFGHVKTSSDILILGNVDISGASTIDTTDNTSEVGADLNIGSIASTNTAALILDSGAGRTTVSGTVDQLSTLTILNSGGTTFQGAVGQIAPFNLIVETTTPGETIAFPTDAAFNSITTQNTDGYNLSFTGGVTEVTDAVNFTNNGNLVLGNASTDELLFRNGMTYSGSGTTQLFGRLRTAGALADLGSSVQLGNGTSTIDTTNSSGNPGGANIDLGVVNGANSTLEIDAGTGGNVVTFSGNTQLQSLTTFSKDYRVSFLGNDNTITDPVNFLNTGDLTFGDQSSDAIEFTGGVSVSSDANIAGTVSTVGTPLNLLAVTIMDGTTATLETSGGNVDIAGPITGTVNSTDAGSETLTIDAGAGNVILGTIDGAVDGLTDVIMASAADTTFGQITLPGSLTQSNAATGNTLFTDTVSLNNAVLNGVNFDVQQGMEAAGSVNVTNSGLFTLSGNTAINAANAFTTTGDVNLAANLTTGNADIGIGGNLTLADQQNIDIATGGGDFAVNGTTEGTALNNPETLTLDAGTGAVTFGPIFGANGGPDPTGLVDVTVVNSGAISFDEIGISGSLTQTNAATGNTVFNNTVSLDGANLFGTNIIFSDFTASGNLSVDATGSISQTTGTRLTVGGLLQMGANDVTLTDLAASGGVDLSVTQDVILTNNQDLALSGTVGGDLAATANGALTLRSGQSLSVTGNSTFVGDTLLMNDLSAAGTITLDIDQDAIITNGDAATLEGSVGANLTVTTVSGAITDSGQLAVTGLGTFETQDGSDITLDNASNTFGSVNLTGGTVTLNEADGTELDNVIATSLAITSGGNITEAAGAQVAVSGLASLSAGAGNADITLLENNNEFGSLALTANHAAILEQGDMQLDSVNATSVELEATGSVTDGTDADILVTGNASITASTDVILGNEPGDIIRFGTISVDADNFELNEADGTSFDRINVAGDVTVTSRSVIDQAFGSIMTVGGAVSLNANSGRDSIVLGEVNNSFGSLILEGGDATIFEADTSTDFDFVNVENLEVVASGDVSATGQMIVESELDIVANNGLGNVTLDNANNELNSLTLDANDVVVVNNQATRLLEIDISSLTLTSTGNVTDGENELDITGLASITTDGNITLGDNNPAQFGSISLFGNSVDVTQTDNIKMDVSSISSALSLTSTGGNIEGITGATIDVVGDTSIVAGDNATVDFSASINTFGDLSVTAGTASVSETDDIGLELVDVDSLTLNSGANITDITGAQIDVLNDATLVATGNIVLGDGESDQFNAGNINLTATDANITESSATQIAGLDLAGILTLASAGSVTDAENGILNVTGKVTVNADEGDADIVLDNSQNSFGSVDLTGAFVQLNEQDTSLIERVIANSLNVTSSDITVAQSAELAVEGSVGLTGNSVMVESGGDIQLGSLDIVAATNAVIRSSILPNVVNGVPTNPQGEIAIDSPEVTMGIDGDEISLITQAGNFSISGLDAAGVVELLGRVNIDATNGGDADGANITIVNDEGGIGTIDASPQATGDVVLALTAGTGNITLGQVGTINPLTALLIDSANNVSTQQVTTTNSISMDAAGDLTLNGDVAAQSGTLSLTTSGGSIETSGTLTSGGDLEARASQFLLLGSNTTSSNGSVTLRSTDSTIVSDGIIDAGTNADIAAGDTVTLNESVTAGGSVNIGAIGDIELNGTDGSGLSTGDDANIRSTSGDLLFNSDLDIGSDLSAFSVAGELVQAQNTTISAGGSAKLSAETGMQIASIDAANDITLVITQSGLDANGDRPLFERVNDPDSGIDLLSSDGSIIFLSPSANVGTADDPFVQRAESAGQGIFYGLQEGEAFSVDTGVSQILSNPPGGFSSTDLVNNDILTLGDDINIALPGDFATNYENLLSQSSNATGRVGQTEAAASSRSTAASQREEEEEVAEVDEAAFQNLKNYDENPQGIRLPADQRFAYDDEGNIYFIVTLPAKKQYEQAETFVLYRVDLDLEYRAVPGKEAETGQNGRDIAVEDDYKPSLVQLSMLDNLAAGGGGD